MENSGEKAKMKGKKWKWKIEVGLKKASFSSVRLFGGIIPPSEGRVLGSEWCGMWN